MTPHGAKVKAGQDLARAAGVHVGRPPNRELTPEVMHRAHELRAGGASLRAIARTLRVPKSTIERHLARSDKGVAAWVRP